MMLPNNLSWTLLMLCSTSAAMTTWEGGPTFDITYDTAQSKLKFDVSVPENMWFGIAYKESMINTDMVVFAGKGDEGTITDLWSTSYK